ncbi:MAG: LysR family transcriptional regulator [Pseudomonadota bacterium]
MDFKWIEDFLALASARNFTEAAKIRHVSQSAFSRRIQSLEDWMGMELVDRRAYPVTLTAAGEHFLFSARDLVEQMSRVQRECQSKLLVQKSQISLTTLHVLKHTFFSNWLSTIEADLGPHYISAHADAHTNCVHTFTSQKSDFFLCYNMKRSSGDVVQVNSFSELQGYDHLHMGQETFIPVSAATEEGSALHSLSYTQDAPAPYISYSSECFLFNVMDMILRQSERSPALIPCYHHALSETLKALVLSGTGIAWLPQSFVQYELDRRTLIRLDDGELSLPLDILLYRSLSPLSKEAEHLWSYLEKQQALRMNANRGPIQESAEQGKVFASA